MNNNAVSKEDLEVKIKEYSSFIDKKLHPELKVRVEAREKVEHEIADYDDLVMKLKSISSSSSSSSETSAAPSSSSSTAADADADKMLESMVDLGYQTVYCRATAVTEKIFLHVGMGFHIEQTIPEAITTCEKRITFLEHLLDQRVAAATQVARHVESALIILEELAKEMKEHS